MVPKSCQEAGEAGEEALSSTVDREPVGGPLGPPASTPADPAAPAGPKDTEPSSTGVDFPPKLHLAPESLDPRTLKLLWRQRDLEIQALRSTLGHPRSTRRGRVLQEVAGFPSERSSRRQNELLRTQVQKLTLELKEQREQAQLEKAHLEAQLLHAKQLLQQAQAELQALEKSCLLQLARASWVGRMLRSSTGSMEVVTAETLIDPSDLSEDGEVPPAREGFRLEDVDWNSVAHRYPNLFATTKSNVDYKHREPPPPAEQPAAPAPEERDPRPSVHLAERGCKTVEWRPLPSGGTSSSGGADSDSSSPRPDPKSRVQTVTWHPPRAPGHTSQRTEPQAGGGRRASQAEPHGRCRPGVLDGRSTRGSTSRTGVLFLDPRDPDSDGPGQSVPARRTDSDHRRPGHQGRRVVALSRRQTSVRVATASLEETAGLGGLALQRLRRGVPVCARRFPPRDQVTVWGQGPRSTEPPPPSSPGRGAGHFQSSRGCGTLLLSPEGEVLSRHQAPPRATQASQAFDDDDDDDDDTDLSVDRLPLSDAPPGAASSGCGPRAPRSLLRPQAPAPHKPPPAPRPQAASPAGPSPAGPSPGGPPFPRARSAHTTPRPAKTPAPLPRVGTRQPLRPPAAPARPERAGTATRELRPAVSGAHVPGRGARGLAARRAGKERRVRVARKTVDRSCPMVALSVPSSAERRHGVRILGCPPVPADARGRR